MKIQEDKPIKLAKASFTASVKKFEESDRKRLYEIYITWKNLCMKLKKMNMRATNVPEGLSEGSLCLETRCVIILKDSIKTTKKSSKGPKKSSKGPKKSFDCYDLRNEKRIQVKASSVEQDLSSFGPTSVWDEVYFMDFYKEGNWDGKFDIYKIKKSYILNCKVNKNKTFVQQQKTGKRPRFSIYKNIIQKKGIKPFKKGDLAKPVP